MRFGELRERLRKRPFEPFRVILSSGESCEVRRPETALLLKSRILVAERDGRGRPPEVAVWCDFTEIAAVETIAASNGQ
jgi:hypothetical protein